METKKITPFFTLLAGFMMLANINLAMAQEFEPVDMSQWIELTVNEEQNIQVYIQPSGDFSKYQYIAAVKVVSGNFENMLLLINGFNPQILHAYSGTIRIYGKVAALNCNYNGENITELRANNTLLYELSCNANKISYLDVNQCTGLKNLYCYDNNISTLDISKLTNLELLECNINILTSLNVSKNTKLKKLHCGSNSLTSLNVSNLTALESLSCSYCKNLTDLDINGCTALKTLYCYESNLSTQALDDIYCALPQCPESDKGKIVPVKESSSPNYSTVMATNKDNAIKKNWQVQYSSGSDIPATSGNYICPVVSYPLWVGGVRVTSANFSAITGEGITGSVSYDAAKTLTLDGATITSSSKKAIEFDRMNLIIDLKNENKVNYTGSNDVAIGSATMGYNLTLQGKGKLDVSSASSLPAISASKLLFDGCNVKVSNTNSFALGATVGGTTAGIELNNCKIETPVNGTIGKHPTKTNIWTILASDNQPAQTVEIVRTGTGLSTLAAEGIYIWGEKGAISINTSGNASGRTAHIYSVSGILVRTLPLQGTEGQVTVPAGIYIVRIGNAIEKVVVR